jgi:hypothetical protein
MAIANVFNMMVGFGQNQFIPVTASTLTIVPATHSGCIIILNRAAGIAVTLPNATGTGNIYSFFVGTTVTSNTTTITRGTTNDVMSGVVLQAKASTAMTPIPTASNTNTLTLNGSTTGGILGDWIQLADVATNQWSLIMLISSTGTVATPLSNT